MIYSYIIYRGGSMVFLWGGALEKIGKILNKIDQRVALEAPAPCYQNYNGYHKNGHNEYLTFKHKS